MNSKATLMAACALVAGFVSMQAAAPSGQAAVANGQAAVANGQAAMANMQTAAPNGQRGPGPSPAIADASTRFVAQMAVKGSPSYATLPKRTRRYVITEFGAVGDGTTVNTKAIQAAIDKCSATKGGGTVVVPKGTFRTGSIFLKQGVNLLVEKDGVLKGTTNPDDYPQIKSRWEGTEEMYTASLVNAEGVTGLEISGEGTIDGAGDEWMAKNPFRRRGAARAGRGGGCGCGRAGGFGCAGGRSECRAGGGDASARAGKAAADWDSEFEGCARLAGCICITRRSGACLCCTARMSRLTG